MSPLPENQLQAELLSFAALPDDGRHREEALNLARLLTGDKDGSVALLYLFDQEKSLLHLDHHEPMANGSPAVSSEGRLAGVSIGGVLRSPSTPFDHSYAQTVVQGHPRIKAFRTRLCPNGKSTFFPIRRSPNSPDGLLEVVTAKPLSEHAKQFLQHLAEFIATRIGRHRYARELKVIKDMTTRPQPPHVTASETERLLRLAARTVRESTLAELVLVFQQRPDLTLQVVASDPELPKTDSWLTTPNSLVRRIFESNGAVRVLHHPDDAERQTLFGTETFDRSMHDRIGRLLHGQIRSWMARTVSLRWQGQDGSFPVALVAAFNKLGETYLPGKFSATDARLLETVCTQLNNAFPVVQVDDAQRRISQHIEAASVSLDNPPDRAKLFSLMQEIVPGVVAAAVVLRDQPKANQNANDVPVHELIGLGPQDRFQNVLEIRDETKYRLYTPKVELLPLPNAESPNFRYMAHPISTEKDGKLANLYVEFRRGTHRLTTPEKEILRSFCNYLSHPVRMYLMLRREINALIQVRHAIRASLMGLSHVDIAQRAVVDLIHYLDAVRNTSESTSITSTTRAKLNKLRKSLEHARMFTDRSRVLVEESRFLLENISADNLNLQPVNILEIIKECVRSVSPDIERKGMEYIIDSHVPGGQETAMVDEQLILIALFNLIENGVKYAHDRTKLKITFFGQSGYWHCMVDDLGVWIPSADYSRIFEPMERVPTGHSHRIRPGTGLGLSVAKKVAEAHGGDITVRSTALSAAKPEDGADTSFTIRIPRQLRR